MNKLDDFAESQMVQDKIKRICWWIICL